MENDHMPTNDYSREDARTPEEALVAEIQHEMAHSGASPIDAMLAALGEALSADMEQGAHWMNEAEAAQFKRKYPRFTTLFAIARYVDWSTAIPQK
jgi:hypothetical protein